MGDVIVGVRCSRCGCAFDANVLYILPRMRDVLGHWCHVCDDGPSVNELTPLDPVYSDDKETH